MKLPIIQLTRFFVVGSAITALDVTVFTTAYLFVPQSCELNSTFAKLLSLVCLIPVAFFLHRRFTFQSQKIKGPIRQIRFTALNFIAFAISLVPFWLLDTFYPSLESVTIASLLNLIVIASVAIFRFVSYKTFVWPETKTEML